MMKLLDKLKFTGYIITAIGLVYFVWGTSISAKNNELVVISDVDVAANISMEPIQPIPLSVNLNPKLVELGELLFKSSLMSEKGAACTTCHNINLAGNDGLTVAIDIHGGNNLMNTPTVFNASLNPLLTWFGETKKLGEMIDILLTNPKTMDGNWKNIIERIDKDAELKVRFEKLFKDGVTQHNIKVAIADFLKSLITPNSDFDKYLRGDKAAISKDQKKGYSLFKQYGCIACHQGINVGGNMHAKFGTFVSPFENTPKATPQSKYNLGLYNVTGNESDRNVFRVPGLRNVAITSPYFHTGEVADLENAIKFMARLQVGREMPDEDARYIAEFLRALTGEYKGRHL